MRVIEQKNLWERIKNFSIDDPLASIKFSDKLSFQNRWTKDYTDRVIEEYKRFIFLCCISPTGASPSEDVDQAWHLHLTYTQNYWKEFCQDTLQKEIHHHPSKGGTDEKYKHLSWYEDTLTFYSEVFDEEPPPDIWPPPKKEINKGTLIPANIKVPMLLYYQVLLVMGLPFATLFFYGVTSPYKLTGPQFLMFFPILAAASFIALYLLYRYNKNTVREIMVTNYNNDANVYQLTRFAFGRNRSVQTAIVDLVKREVLIPERDGRFIFYPNKYAYSPDEKNPVILNLLKLYKEGELITYESIIACYNDDMTYHARLAEIFKMIATKQRWAYLIGLFVAVIGIARWLQGERNEKPIAYLVFMLMTLAFVYLIIYKSIGYKNAFKDIVKDGYRNHELGEEFKVSSTVNQFAFLGFIALGADYYVTNLQTAFKDNKASGDGGSSDGCGSSGCGSSCGGGCGGGCGGCGGGD